MTRANTIAALLLTVVLAGSVLAQTADTATVNRLTARAVQHLTTKTRFAYTAGLYGDVEFGKKFGNEAFAGYFGDTAGLVRVTEVGTDPKTEKKFGLWANGDRLINTKKGENGGTVIFRHHVAWASESDTDHFAGFYANLGISYFFLPSAAQEYGRSRNPDSLPRVEPRNPPVTTITEATHRGRPCIKVVVTPHQGGSSPFKSIVTEYHLDREHGMVLTKRQKGMLHVPKGTTSATLLNVDQVTEITYGPPTENGLPFPTAVKGWFVWPTGRREPMTDVEFTEFRRYTPTADELDFEKQFGIPLPALPPKPGFLSSAGGGKGGRVVQWLGGGLAVTAVAAVGVYLWRRRTARRGEPAADRAEGAV